MEENKELDALASKIAAQVSLSENLQGIVTDAVEKAVRDRGLDRVARKAGLFGSGPLAPSEEKRRFERAYLLGILKLGINPRADLDDAVVKALSEGSATAGGYLAPPGYQAELEKLVPELSEVFPFVRKVPVITDTGDFPTLATGVSITWGRAENDDIAITDPVFGHVDWAIAGMSAVTFISRELVDDANPGIVDTVQQLFAEAIAAERDKKICIGDGDGEPEGLVSASGIAAVDGCSGALTYDKLISLKFTLPRKHHAGGRWIMSENTLSWCLRIKDEQKMPILRDPLIADAPSLLLGKPYSTQADLTDGLIFFGNLGKYAWFDRQRMLIETTTTGGETFRKHQLGIKVVERVDGKVAQADAFRKSGAFTVPA